MKNFACLVIKESYEPCTVIYNKKFSNFGIHSKLLPTFVWGTHKDGRQFWIHKVSIPYTRIPNKTFTRESAFQSSENAQILKTSLPSLKRATSLNNSTRTLMLVFSCWKARLSLSINCAKSLSETKQVKVYSASD